MRLKLTWRLTLVTVFAVVGSVHLNNVRSSFNRLLAMHLNRDVMRRKIYKSECVSRFIYCLIFRKEL